MAKAVAFCAALIIAAALPGAAGAAPVPGLRTSVTARHPHSGNSGRAIKTATSSASTTTNIRVSGTGAGETFGGVGAISGGGGNSRYLIDYPRPERDRILDDLFKPHYGASLQVLKVEIGGDGNSTDGAEPSIEHTAGAIDCDSGYEWWLMEAARARNPDIKLYGLAWGAPGWIGGGNLWSQDMISYVLSWMNCAARHNLTIDYLGGWNENGYNATWFEDLRAALDASGYASTQLVASDEFPSDTVHPVDVWNVASDMASDPAFSAAVSVVGEHDMCGYPTTGTTCLSTSTARGLGKPLWASELGAMGGDSGAPDMARSMIRGYTAAKLTSYITWPMVAAMPPGLPHETTGLVTASQPWSGHYTVNAMTWAIAQVSQFTKPGWVYINGASGYLGGKQANGSYVTLKSPGNTGWSTIAETTTTSAPQNAHFTVTRGLPRSTVHVWRTAPASANPANWFVRRANLHPVRGSFSFALRPGYVYSFTTTSGQAKGSTSPPPSRSFPRPYSATLRRSDPSAWLDGEPWYLSAMDGSIGFAPCQGGRAGYCAEQMTPEPPIYWRPHSGFPYAVIGDDSWSNSTTSVKVLFTQPDSSAGVIGRFSRVGTGVSNFRGYILDLADSGSWRLLKNSVSVGPRVLASGTVTAPRTGTWHTVSLTTTGTVITARIDGQRVVSVTDRDRNYATGTSGIEAGATEVNGMFTGTSWPMVQYTDLNVRRP
jgi:hypothetical protein